MANPAGESNDGALRLDFDRRSFTALSGSAYPSARRISARAGLRLGGNWKGLS
jgi:hypothetical protein